MSAARPVRYPHVQSPVVIGDLRLPHRIVMGSMHLNLETLDDDGRALAAFYAERVRGGASFVITGGAAVSRVGAGGPGYALINEPSSSSRYRRVVDAVHDAGGIIALQLFHAGRYAIDTPRQVAPIAPSALYSAFSRTTPEEMSAARITDTIAEFASGAARAVDLGFDAVEVMGSEGYLINQFASPVTNRRDDEWGGDALRRRAFPSAVVRAVRGSVGLAPVVVRMSGADLVPGSSPPEEIDALAIALVEAGADALDIGVGWHESRVPTVQSLVPHGMWVQTAARIKDTLLAADATKPVITSNRINSFDHAEHILASTHIDLVSMARPFLADPDITLKSFAGMPELVNTCIGCNEACIDRSFGSTPVSCLVNPRAGRELEFSRTHQPSQRVRRPEQVAVIGAGPAGMEAARAVAAGGAAVLLLDEGDRIGGQFLMAGMVPGKSDFLETVRYFEHELERLHVEVSLGTRVDSAGDVRRLTSAGHVIVASGVHARPVILAGVELPHVIDYPEAFRNPDRIGRRVAIIGAGGIAVDLAHLLVEVSSVARFGNPAPIDELAQRAHFLATNDLADQAFNAQALSTQILPAQALTAPVPRQITIMRRSGAIGAGMGTTTRWAVVQTIRRAGVRTLTDVTYQHIDERGVWIEHDGETQLIEADTVIIAAGQEPHPGPSTALRAAGISHTVIGGALHTAGMNAVAAFEQGLRVGTALGSPHGRQRQIP